jgi:predicted XRE-type DNA-binding protein
MIEKERFLARVSIDPETGCWNWKSIKQRKKDRYGYFGSQLAHRASYGLFKGDMPDGMFVCHSCDNKRCVNPDHLFLGTAKENVEDHIEKGLRNNKTLNVSEEVAEQIRELYEYGGITQTELAIYFGTNQSAVSKIINGSENYKRAA